MNISHFFTPGNIMLTTRNRQKLKIFYEEKLKYSMLLITTILEKPNLHWTSVIQLMLLHCSVRFDMPIILLFLERQTKWRMYDVDGI